MYLCLSSSSDDHHLSHSCLGTGMRFGPKNKFCHYRSSLVHSASSIVFCCCWCVGVSSVTILPLLVQIIRTFATVTIFVQCVLANTLQYHDTVDFVQDSKTPDPHDTYTAQSTFHRRARDGMTHRTSFRSDAFFYGFLWAQVVDSAYMSSSSDAIVEAAAVPPDECGDSMSDSMLQGPPRKRRWLRSPTRRATTLRGCCSRPTCGTRECSL